MTPRDDPPTDEAAPPDDSPRPGRWPWLLAFLALSWLALVRIPLILNAETHLDSDLAVDGLTVAEVARGHWRWHFPGTPHIGISSALLSAPQMAWWGPSPRALVSGGTVAYALLVLAAFLLAWTAFGPRVAAWGLVPLAFSSTGTLWLSGRLNGGHLLAAAWHAGALALLHGCLSRGGVGRSAVLGVWCGLGLFHDSMFAITIAALVPCAIAAWWASGRPARGWACAVAFVAAAFLGDLPREVGNRLDPHDAYSGQFSPNFEPSVLAEHVRILALECLPRLIAGHLLPDLGSEPSAGKLLGHPSPRRPAQDDDPLAWATTLGGLGLFAMAIVALVRDRERSQDVARTAVRRALLASSAAIVAAFVVNRNIFNSDNYRYIVYLLVPWSVGFGLAMESWSRRGWRGALAAGAVALSFAALMTIDTARWYARLGWIDEDGRLARRSRPDPVLAWLEEHPEVSSLSGDYWDVYRLSFMTAGRVRGIPYPIYPDRYPEWSRNLPGGRPDAIVVRPSPRAEYFLGVALRDGAKPAMTAPDVTIYRWPGR